ncbi:MAG TPA: ABC transporter permease [Tepidisphaeraceae bacterium]|nr:ABC transporter permease [Tepidisphaeraceae bacterium]
MRLLRLLITPLVLIYQSVFLALGQVWSNKVRSMLTTVGIVIGVASVTAVIAALTGLKQNVLTEFAAMGTNKLFISPWPPDEASQKYYHYRATRFRPHDFDGLLQYCPSVASFTRTTYLNGSGTVSHGPHVVQNVDIHGIEPSWHQVENRTVVTGRPFSLIDNEQARAVCLINDKAQHALGLNADPTGQDIMIGDRRFIVVGVIESQPQSTMFGNGQTDSEIYIPFSTAYTNPYQWVRAEATSKSPEVSDEARAEIRFFLRYKRHLGVDKPDNFNIEAVQKMVDQFKSVATAITLVASGIVGISLLVGGVGIMNIMLVSVSERTREIGLRKAVGARPMVILLQFLVEALVLCLLGGLMGLLCGEGIVAMLKLIKDAKLDKAAIPGWAVALSFGFAATVGLVFGMFPAIKAARLDPIEALRHE